MVDARRLKENREITLILLIGLIIRLKDITAPFSGLNAWNEGHYSVTALNYFKYGVLVPVNEYGLDLTTTPIYTWLIHLSFRIFGIHEWAARMPSLIFGLTSIALTYLIGKRLYGNSAGLLAALITALSPGIAYYSKSVQLESMQTAFILAALLFILIYTDSDDTRFLAASATALAIAILIKYPSVLAYPPLLLAWGMKKKRFITKKELTRLLIYIIAPLLPTLIWLETALTLTPSWIKWYFHKEGVPWTLDKAIQSLTFFSTLAWPKDFGWLFTLIFILGLPLIIIKEGKRHAVILLYIVIWLPMLFLFPDFYIKNTYYHYPLLYGTAILAGYVVARGLERVSSARPSMRVAVSAILILAFLASGLYGLRPFTQSYTDFSSINESEPFYSARFVAERNTAHDPVIADLPMTMFYLGGDPEYIDLAFKNHRLIKAVKSQRYTYVVTYYLGNKTLSDTLQTYNYTRIAPRAWERLRPGPSP